MHSSLLRWSNCGTGSGFVNRGALVLLRQGKVDVGPVQVTNSEKGKDFERDFRSSWNDLLKGGWAFWVYHDFLMHTLKGGPHVCNKGGWKVKVREKNLKFQKKTIANRKKLYSTKTDVEQKLIEKGNTRKKQKPKCI